ncbi:hypothetical protein N5J43_08200 [Pseudomonas nicosulfuronedens]|uniref:hypothetical protein n=1 Tax=Pseudomonas nicosulfuronedens TaxID=2571105 RepID=UPI00244A869B|nr:hypothetical protein [Pseudomonas nicosulfuronedens]MDH1009954.1 hypothetical protein [Pseudomonas nicosulfuronedens]MDH1978930.1 hypothetical protein [Pseudomonas nicosulfuronedens]MDH2028391.1 hypothetical protein [Pseudomonas nicosulfuronedens]
MAEENELLAIAGINPKTNECRFIGRRHPDDVMEALNLGLIIVPVTAEKARWAFGEKISSMQELAS